MGYAPFSSLLRVLCIQLIRAEFCLCRYLGWGWQKELAETCQEAWENKKKFWQELENMETEDKRKR